MQWCDTRHMVDLVDDIEKKWKLEMKRQESGGIDNPE